MQFLTIKDAAARVGRSVQTIYRWEREGLISIMLGRVLEAELLEVDKLTRSRRGRPRKAPDIR